VVFAPSTPGSYAAALIIRGADGKHQQTVPLSGRGIDQPPTPPDLQWLPPSVSFGRHPVNGPAVSQPVVLRNAGSSAVEVRSVSLTGGALGDFAVGGECRVRLEPDQTCTVNVSFVPRAAGPRSAELVASWGEAALERAALSGEGSRVDCVLDPIGPQTVPYGGRLSIPVRATGASAATKLTVSNLHEAKVEPISVGQWSLQGVMMSPPSPPDEPRLVTVSAFGGGCLTHLTFPLTIDRADVSIRWLEPLVDLTVGTPPSIEVVVSQAPGNKGDLTKAKVLFELHPVLAAPSISVLTVDPFSCQAVPRSDGLATLCFKPGELPLGTYAAIAMLDADNQYFRMSSDAPESVVVNTDVASAAVNALSPVLAGP
jgi:hypothetical protein